MTSRSVKRGLAEGPLSWGALRLFTKEVFVSKGECGCGNEPRTGMYCAKLMPVENDDAAWEGTGVYGFVLRGLDGTYDDDNRYDDDSCDDDDDD